MIKNLQSQVCLVKKKNSQSIYFYFSFYVLDQAEFEIIWQYYFYFRWLKTLHYQDIIRNESKFLKEITAAQYTYTFSVQYLAVKMENKTDVFSSYWMEKENPTRDFASFETFLFWFGFCAIRVLSTFGSRYIQPRSMLWANLVGLSLSSIGLFFSTSPLFSTFCIFLFGCSIATCFPTAIAFAQTKTDVTGNVQPHIIK